MVIEYERLGIHPTLTDISTKAHTDSSVYSSRYSRSNESGSYSPGNGYGDCRANTRRLIEAAQSKGIDISSAHAFLLWYQPPLHTDPVSFAVDNKFLRSEGQNPMGSFRNWNFHVFLVDQKNGSSQQVYDLSAQQEYLGSSLPKYLEHLMAYQVRFNKHSLPNFHVSRIPAKEFITLPQNVTLRQLTEKYGQQNLQQIHPDLFR